MSNLSIAVGSDHAGLKLKNMVVQELTAMGHKVLDIGTDSEESVDYPDYAFKVAQAVKEGKADFGVLVCFTGIGMSIAANKVNGIRAALCCDTRRAELARRHNDANILCLGAGFIDNKQLPSILSAFLEAEFEGLSNAGERHNRRVNKIKQYERMEN